MLEAAQGTDLVGIYAAGPVWRGFANSEGQRNWHETTTFNMQWSLYYRADKAVKTSHAGFAWDGAALAQKMDGARERLALIAVRQSRLRRGNTVRFSSRRRWTTSRVCCAGAASRPRACDAAEPARTDATGERLDARVSLTEDTAGGVAPVVPVRRLRSPVEREPGRRGALVGSLVSRAPHASSAFPRTAPTAKSRPSRWRWRPETLAQKDALDALGTGLAIGNLHYLNYSDRPACRMTGMTRFATFWVEDGKIVAPVDVLRFDDTIYRMLGSNLEALTAETELLLDAGTYGCRKLSSLRLPGALVAEMAFTL